MRSRSSRRPAGWPFQRRAALVEPRCPPSGPAPFSDYATPGLCCPASRPPLYARPRPIGPARPWRARVVVLVERGDELVGLATVEAGPALEAASARPGVARRGHVRLVLGGEVPLAHCARHVAVGAEDLGQEAVATRDATPVAGEADRE